MRALSTTVKNYFSSKVVFLTGASTGIGRELALHLASAGAKVALVARRKELLEELAKEIKDKGGESLAVPADVADRKQILDAAGLTKKTFGPVDMLIANAGVGGTRGVDNFSGEDVARTIQINVLGAVYAIEAVLPDMLTRRSGHIAAVSSLAAWRGLPRSSAYSASKAALSTYLESLRQELIPQGIWVTTICPGFVKSPMTDKNEHPMPFMVDTDDAARRILTAMAQKKKEFAFPPALSGLMKFTRALPIPLYDLIAQKLLMRFR